MFTNRSGQNEQSVERTFHRCFLPSFSSFGWGISEEKIKLWKVNGQRTPSYGKSSHCLWQGELLIISFMRMCNLTKFLLWLQITNQQCTELNFRKNTFPSIVSFFSKIKDWKKGSIKKNNSCRFIPLVWRLDSKSFEQDEQWHQHLQQSEQALGSVYRCHLELKLRFSSKKVLVPVYTKPTGEQLQHLQQPELALKYRKYN